MAQRPPTLRRRRLGAQLRRLREERGLTQDEACLLLNLSKSTLHRMENARVVVRRHEVDYILTKYEVTSPAVRESLMGLASPGPSREWVRRNRLVFPTKKITEYHELEIDSSRVRSYYPELIPGLVQTPGYARAVMGSFKYTPEELDRHVEFRMARKEVFDREPPLRYEAVIGEATLRMNTGGPFVMAEQMGYLLKVSYEDDIQLRVLPFSATTVPGIDGSFSILDVETGNFTVVALAALTRAQFLQEDDEVARYLDVYEDLCSLALSVEDSRLEFERAARAFRAMAGGAGGNMAEEQQKRK
ncbi:helix-turn-helix domain-containing protein [Actinomadura rupiterrae]|uniref:helix-turn-helix domain-containing protein n=1 Tax=Actinomadura rupiterrae TaxID=559627 RepID=UPI0020A58DB6|nr:helix-turn-helix transcriptional regulator [Actinomadura rupiterrae]MCP2340743.1 transcriptional regulator with XRE-family HTH domain [Actinomadura rupiterrae]